MKLPKNRIIIIAVLIFLAVCLLALSFVGDRQKTDDQDELSAYINSLEKSLEEIISKLDGVKDVNVMVTILQGYEKIYGVDSVITEDSKQNEYHEASGEPLLLSKCPPKVKGVAVVCDGGNDGYIKTEIITLLSSLLDISMANIYVGS